MESAIVLNVFITFFLITIVHEITMVVCQKNNQLKSHELKII